MISRLLAITAALICIYCTSACTVMADLAPSKSARLNVRDWIVVPVFFRTNRTKKPSPWAFSDDELNHHGQTFGVRNVIIPLPDDADISPELAYKMGWRQVHMDQVMAPGKKPPIPQDCKIADREVPLTEVLGDFDKYRKATGQQQVVLFAHGCCATFETSLERAAKIAVRMQLPLVIYDWVSPTGFTNYLKNETLAEQELDDFSRFLANTEALIPPAETTVIGHSLGAKFVDNALVRRWERHRDAGTFDKYSEVIFSNPDIDATAYIAHCNNLALNAKQLRIYMNTEDGRLHASSLAHGGYPRLGRPETLLPQLCNTQDQDLIDVTAIGAGHEMPFWVIADMHNSGKLGDKRSFLMQEKEKHLFVLKKQGGVSARPQSRSGAPQSESCDCSSPTVASARKQGLTDN